MPCAKDDLAGLRELEKSFRRAARHADDTWIDQLNSAADKILEEIKALENNESCTEA